ncbi:MAG TPA: hypothetical protein VKF15_06460 [Nitrososphaerales archaeon]|nr:hypothetical protein [Nitrososphaerales archaeon]
MDGIVHCPNCGASVIAEEEEFHKCGIGKPTIRRVVDVAYQWWLKAKGDPLIAIMGADGTLYRFLPSPNAGHPYKSPEEDTKPCLAKKCLSEQRREKRKFVGL